MTLSLPESGFILHTTSCHHEWEGEGLLSINTFRGGQAFYRADGLLPGCRYVVDKDSFLVLNQGQHYGITIDSPTPVESFCVFFPAGLAEQVQHTLSTRSERLLDDPFPAALPPVRFFERTYPHDERLQPLLDRLRTLYLKAR